MRSGSRSRLTVFRGCAVCASTHPTAARNRRQGWPTGAVAVRASAMRCRHLWARAWAMGPRLVEADCAACASARCTSGAPTAGSESGSSAKGLALRRGAALPVSLPPTPPSELSAGASALAIDSITRIRPSWGSTFEVGRYSGLREPLSDLRIAYTFLQKSDCDPPDPAEFPPAAICKRFFTVPVCPAVRLT